MNSAERARASNLLATILDEPEFHSTTSRRVLLNWLLFRVESIFEPGGTLVDLGGGFSPVNAVLTQMGMSVTVVDLMSTYMVHSTEKSPRTAAFERLSELGVDFVEGDLLEVDLTEHFEADSVDVAASFHAFEHLHHSPRKLLSGVDEVLRSNGRLFIEVPNAVNLLKRFKVLIGQTNYLPYRGYFDSEQYVGHVREYTVDDLRHMAEGSGFEIQQISGANYYGTLYSKLRIPALGAIADRVLRVRPGLCSALFLTAARPQRAAYQSAPRAAQLDHHL